MPRFVIDLEKAIHLRNQYNLTAAEIASRLGCSASTIRIYFSKHKVPRTKNYEQRSQSHQCAMPRCSRKTTDKFCYVCFHKTTEAAKRGKEFWNPGIALNAVEPESGIDADDLSLLARQFYEE